MDTQIDRMIPANVETAEMIIKRETQIGDIAVGWKKTIHVSTGVEKIQTLNGNILRNREFVIEYEGDLKGVGVSDDPCQQDEKNPGERAFEKGIHTKTIDSQQKLT